LGWARMWFSTSSALIFSAPRLMVSLIRAFNSYIPVSMDSHHITGSVKPSSVNAFLLYSGEL
jgi:hypothetical protein